MYNCPRQRYTSSLVHDVVPNLLYEHEDSPPSDAADAACQTDQNQHVYTNSSVQTSFKMASFLTLQKKIRSLQNQLRKLKCSERRRQRNSRSINKVEDLPPDLADFVTNQLRNVNKAPRGRRYTARYYKNCFVLYHHSRRCYAALRNIFAMPSPRCLRTKLKSFFNEVRSSRLNNHLPLNFFEVPISGLLCNENYESEIRNFLTKQSRSQTSQQT